MEKSSLSQQLVLMQKKIDFYEKILDNTPHPIYFNTYTEPGNPYSLVNKWSNRCAQKFIGYSQAEIDELGFSFFKKVLHPDDLEIITTNKVQEITNTQSPEIIYTFLQRLKPKGINKYIWVYGRGIQIEAYEGGFPKTLLSSFIEITDQMHTNNQLVIALNEINKFKNELQCQSLTKREKEVLQLIANGLTDHEIGKKFFISFATAKTHRNNIIKKLGLKNTAALASFATKCGFNC